MSDIIKLTLALCIIAALAGLAIGFTYSKTESAIAAQQQQAQNSALQNVLPTADTVITRSGQEPLPQTYWEARLDSHVIAYAFLVSSRGYSSDIRMMIGVDTNGTIMGLTVMEQAETPGLGTRVVELPATRYIWNGLFGPADTVKPWFCEQFEGISITQPIAMDKTAEWHAMTAQQRSQLEQRNGVTVITGATISTKAVINGLQSEVTGYLEALRKRNAL